MRFSKMHGAGNDFVVIDLRDGSPAPTADLCRLLGDRHLGVGCDQILTIEAPRAQGSIASYGIWNSDGSPSGQCGNGARCVAAWLVRDGAAQGQRFRIDSPVGTHDVEHLGGDHYRIDMGIPDFAPAAIPLKPGVAASDPYVLCVDGDDVAFGAVSMGNPHAVVEVDDVRGADVERIGPAIQSSSLFPNSANVGFVQVLAPDRIRLRVHERGAGETLACGSGACAAAAVLMRRGRIGRDVAVELPGGTLRITWPGDASAVTMAGPTAFAFEGELPQLRG